MAMMENLLNQIVIIPGFLPALFFVLGACIGSFLNVCIFRLPRQESIIFPASHCMNCGAKLKPLDNIPLLSFLFLGGKCRYCHAKISWEYPRVELLSAILFALGAIRFGLQ